MKRKLQFEDQNCSEAAQLENKIHNAEGNQIDADIQKEFMENNKLILKTQQRFGSERHNAFTEEISKIALSSNDDKIIQSIDLIT